MQKAAERIDLFQPCTVIMAPTKGQVPESVLKKRKRDEDWAAKKAAALADSKKHRKSNRKDIFKRAEQYVKEYRDQVRQCLWLVQERLAWSLLDDCSVTKRLIIRAFIQSSK